MHHNRWITGAILLALAGACGEGEERGTQGGSGITTLPGESGGSTGGSTSGTGSATPTTSGDGGTGTGDDASATTTGASTTVATTSDTGGAETGGAETGGEACEPPDVLVLLDRTLTMHRTPGGAVPVDAPDYASAKLSQAIAAIEALTQPPLDGAVRFGLELWPRDPGGCVTLEQRILGTKEVTNPACEAGDVVIEPGLGNGGAIADLLDPESTTLCSSTPTGAALETALAYFAANKTPGREQYAVLVTDGADWDKSCPEPDPLGVVHALADAGVETFVVGFSAEESPPSATAYLNDLACAGRTAKNFPGPCVEEAGGWVAIDSDAPSPVYLQADDAVDLGAALQSVAGELCCGCPKTCDPPDVMIALDRTLTMHRTPDGAVPVDAPDYASSKWWQAIAAVEQMVQSGLDDDLRFGLELWPRDPGGCVTLAERVEGTKMVTNPACEPGEVLIEPALATGQAIADLLDPKTTTLCASTPTGSGLLTAAEYLTKHITPGRRQSVVLITDGADWDQSCPEPAPLPIVQQLAAAGIQTYVVGFEGTEPDPDATQYLNDLACAGQTAAGFPAPCKQVPGGYVAADPDDPTPLYLRAGDGELTTALTGLADSIAATCVPG